MVDLTENQTDFALLLLTWRRIIYRYALLSLYENLQGQNEEVHDAVFARVTIY